MRDSEAWSERISETTSRRGGSADLALLVPRGLRLVAPLLLLAQTHGEPMELASGRSQAMALIWCLCDTPIGGHHWNPRLHRSNHALGFGFVVVLRKRGKDVRKKRPLAVSATGSLADRKAILSLLRSSSL